MKLIIDIPNDLYEKISKSTENWAARYVEGWDITVARIIRNGTPYEERPQDEWEETKHRLNLLIGVLYSNQLISESDLKYIEDSINKLMKGGAECG